MNISTPTLNWIITIAIMEVLSDFIITSPTSRLVAMYRILRIPINIFWPFTRQILFFPFYLWTGYSPFLYLFCYQQMFTSIPKLNFKPVKYCLFIRKVKRWHSLWFIVCAFSFFFILYCQVPFIHCWTFWNFF